MRRRARGGTTAAPRPPPGAGGSSVAPRSPPFSSVGTDSASRGTSSSWASRRTSDSVTAAARKRADGWSSNTVRGSPTRPTTTSRRAGGAAAHAGPTARSAAASANAARRLRSARVGGPRRDDLGRLNVEETPHRQASVVARDRRGWSRQTDPAEVVHLVERRLRAEILPDHGSGLRSGGLRHLGRSRDREQRDAQRHRDLGDPREERRRPQPPRARVAPERPDRDADPARRERGATGTQRGERLLQGGVDGYRVAERLRALDAARRVELEVEPVKRRQRVRRSQVRALTRAATEREEPH